VGGIKLQSSSLFLKLTASVALRLVWLFLCINCPEDQIARSTRAERLPVNIPQRLGSAENLFHKCPSAERHDRTKTGFCKLTINQRSSRLLSNRYKRLVINSLYRQDFL